MAVSSNGRAEVSYASNNSSTLFTATNIQTLHLLLRGANMEKKCEKCGTLFESLHKRARFCSRKCYPSRGILYEVVCPTCHKVRHLMGRGERGECASCASDKKSGPNSPAWKGGHKQWSSGRHGRDKDGLSWKVQRRLAWERDNFTCQHCHTQKNRKPDVHHIDPWMNSKSHALDNLICLCQSCHLKEEAELHEKWGGQLMTAVPPPPVRPSKRKNPVSLCSGCQRKRVKVQPNGLCHDCNLELVLKPTARAWHEQGVSCCEIGRRLGVVNATVWFWLHPEFVRKKYRVASFNGEALAS